MKNNFFYKVHENKYAICDPEYCSTSNRTFDIKFEELANNKKILESLHLVSDYAGKPKSLNSLNAIDFFREYISSFQSSLENMQLVSDKLKTNPMLRILIMEDNLAEEVKEVINIKNLN